MKNCALLLFLFLFGGSIPMFSQEPTASECKSFRVGTFYYKNMANVIITRDNQFQTETEPNGKYVKMSITWTSDCTYELRLVKTNRRSDKKFWKQIKVLTVTITEVGENSYKFSAVSPALSEAVRGTIIRK